jgi:hypothetical protein
MIHQQELTFPSRPPRSVYLTHLNLKMSKSELFKPEGKTPLEIAERSREYEHGAKRRLCSKTATASSRLNFLLYYLW